MNTGRIIKGLIWIPLAVQIAYPQRSWDPISALPDKHAGNGKSQPLLIPTWQPIGPSTNDVLDFAFNQLNPSVMFAASRDSGVFRTNDGGLVWKQINNGITDRFIRAIATHPRDTSIVLAGGFYKGLFRTSDGGNSWSRVDFTADSTIFSITFDELHPDTVYVGTFQAGVWRSTDAGQSWVKVTPDSLGRTALRVYVDSKYPNVLDYISPDNASVYRSEDFGITWTRIFHGTHEIISFASNPQNRSTIYLGGNPSDSLLRTGNGGNSWEALPLQDIITDLVVNPTDTGQVFACTPGSGVFKSTNSGAGWNPLNDGLSSLEVIRLKLQPNNGSFLYASTNRGAICRGTSLTSGTDVISYNVPVRYNLAQNYPNPFNPTTTIRYGLPHRSGVTLSVFNTLGQRVATLMNEIQEAGFHEVGFDGTNLASGVYLYRLQAGSFVQTRRLLLLK